VNKPNVKMTPAALSRAILQLRAAGDHAAADYLRAHLPPGHDPLPHLDSPQSVSPNVPPSGGAGEEGEEEPEPFAPSQSGAPSIPRPDNPSAEGSLPPRIAKAFDPTSPLDWATHQPTAPVNPSSFPMATVPAPEAQSRKFGCVMLTLPQHAADRILALGRQIPDHDLADNGREDRPHLTALYGIHSDDPAPVLEVLSHFRPARARMTGVSVFPGEEYDVVKADVESDAAHRLNAALKSLPHTSTFPQYVPHVTIAYVRPGLGSVYAARFNHQLDVPFEASTAVFSDSTKSKHHIPLGKTIRVEKAAMSYLSDGSGGTLVRPPGGSRKKRIKLKRNMAAVCKAELEGYYQGWEGREEPTVFDAEEFVFGKAFDESGVSREKTAHDGKRPGEFAPAKGAEADSPTPSSPNGASAFHHSQLSDAHKAALEEIARLFPGGISHLLDAHGRVDEVKALGKEAGNTTASHLDRAAVSRKEWHGINDQMEAKYAEHQKTQDLADADEAINNKVNKALFDPAKGEKDSPFIDIWGVGDDFRDKDDEIANALDAIGSALDDCQNGTVPEHDVISEDDLRNEWDADPDTVIPDDPDMFTDPEHMANDHADEVNQHRERFENLDFEVNKQRQSTEKTSREFRSDLRRDLTTVFEAAKDAALIPKEQWKVAGGDNEFKLVQKLQKVASTLLNSFE
jgi:2'-5' RNA ligase